MLTKSASAFYVLGKHRRPDRPQRGDRPHPRGGRPPAAQEGRAAPEEEPQDALHPRPGYHAHLSRPRPLRQDGGLLTTTEKINICDMTFGLPVCSIPNLVIEGPDTMHEWLGLSLV